MQLAKALEPYKLKWIEECLHPDDYHGYTQLRKSLLGTTLVTTGEHEYSRYAGCPQTNRFPELCGFVV